MGFWINDKFTYETHDIIIIDGGGVLENGGRHSDRISDARLDRISLNWACKKLRVQRQREIARGYNVLMPLSYYYCRKIIEFLNGG